MELLQDFDLQSICVSRAQRLVLLFAAAVVVLYSLALRFFCMLQHLWSPLWPRVFFLIAHCTTHIESWAPWYTPLPSDQMACPPATGITWFWCLGLFYQAPWPNIQHLKYIYSIYTIDICIRRMCTLTWTCFCNSWKKCTHPIGARAKTLTFDTEKTPQQKITAYWTAIGPETGRDELKRLTNVEQHEFYSVYHAVDGPRIEAITKATKEHEDAWETISKPQQAPVMIIKQFELNAFITQITPPQVQLLFDGLIVDWAWRCRMLDMRGKPGAAEIRPDLRYTGGRHRDASPKIQRLK